MKHKCALVTGGFSTLGRAISEVLARRGLEILLHSHRTVDETHISFAEHLETLGASQVAIFNADFRIPESIEAMFQQIGDAEHRPDLLVNNAGIFLRKSMTETDAVDLRTIFSVNTIGPQVCMTQAHQMGVRHIINILDIAWNKSWKHHGAYVATKSALAALTRVAAVEFAPEVRVNGIAPGLISTPPGLEEQYRSVVNRIPMGRKGTPEEVAQVVEFLIDSPHYINGEILTVDGGLSLR